MKRDPALIRFVQLEHILGRYGCFIVERAGTPMDQATDTLARWRDNIYLIPQLIQNDVSSTKVRLVTRINRTVMTHRLYIGSPLLAEGFIRSLLAPKLGGGLYRTI